MAKKTIDVCIRATFWETYSVEVEERDNECEMEQEAHNIALSMAADDFSDNPRRYPEDLRIEDE